MPPRKAIPRTPGLRIRRALGELVSHRLTKGSDLEERIESFFKLSGYATERNVIKQGRSGAPHEIDVFATKNDGVTDFTLLIECKAWDAPIEKAVVSKLSMEMSDLGIHKGIIVSLKGWTTGAELTAKDLGVELWGTLEIRNKLGQVAIAELDDVRSTVRRRGFAVALKEPELSPRLMATARGFLGFGREELIWIKLLWLPFHLVELDHAKSRLTFLKGTVVETTKRWNLYDALSGEFFLRFEGMPGLADVATPQALPPRVHMRKLEKDINDTIKKLESVVRQRTQDRYAAKLEELGVPAGTESTSVIHTELVHVPFFAALLTSGDRHRVVTIDAVWGDRWRSIDASLSENVTFVTEAFGAVAGPEAAAAAAARRSSRPGLTQLAVLAAIGIAEYFAVGPNWFAVAYLVTLLALLLITFQLWKREQGY